VSVVWLDTSHKSFKLFFWGHTRTHLVAEKKNQVIELGNNHTDTSTTEGSNRWVFHLDMAVDDFVSSNQTKITQSWI